MKIELRSMRVINSGPLKDVQIDFTDGQGNPRQTILLAGANGSGKTTILELVFALSELLYFTETFARSDGLAPHIPPANVLKRANYAQMDVVVGGEEVSIFSGKLPSDAHHARTYLGYESGVFQNDQKSIELLRSIGTMLQVQERDIYDLPALSSWPEQTKFLPTVLFIPHFRLIPPARPDKINREQISYRLTYKYEPADRPEGSLDSYLVWLDYAYPERFRQVIEFLNQLDFDGKTFSIRKEELKAIVKTRDGNEHYLEDLSSGEQSILIILLQLRLRLLPGSIVLIDEIEHSLHPAFQYRIAEGLKRMQKIIPFQLIATTHAPAFLDIFGAENTLILTEF